MKNRIGRFFGFYNQLPNQLPLQIHIRRGEVTTIPRAIAEIAFQEYCYRGLGGDQSFQRIHERGGFSYKEVISLLADLVEREREEHAREIEALQNEIIEMGEMQELAAMDD